MTLDTIIFILCIWHNVYTFENYCAKIRAQKLLVFYFLDYPTKVIHNVNNNNKQKNTLDSIICSKESPKKIWLVRCNRWGYHTTHPFCWCVLCVWVSLVFIVTVIVKSRSRSSHLPWKLVKMIPWEGHYLF